VPTASEWSAIVTPLWKVRTGEGVQSYICRKLAERWLGRPLATYGSGAMEQGNLKEPEGIGMYAAVHGLIVQKVGFVTSADGKIGCSPDGMIGREVGLEAKSPLAETHLSYLLEGELPKEYAAQVQGSMLVTGFTSWVFLSYCRGLPPFELTVKRDPKAMAALTEALKDLTDRLDHEWARLLEINGGPPARETGPDLKFGEGYGTMPTPATPEETAAAVAAAEANLDRMGI
jgi:hypothetical protein